MLTKSMKQYVTSKEKNGYSKETQNVYNIRLRTYAIEALKDLALLAEKLPEEQQAQIFNYTMMYPLFHNVFNLSGFPQLRPELEVNQLDASQKEKLEKKRIRTLQLCREAVDEMGNPLNAHLLAPYEMNILLQGGNSDALPALTGIKAIYLRAIGLHEQFR